MNQLYKAQDVLIKAMADVSRSYPGVLLRLVGDGHYRFHLERIAKQLDLSGNVEFLGAVSAGPGVRRILDDCDMFVLPSRQEGLPRAMVEAMARGLPCIGSSVGGIPELLSSPELVPPDDTTALARMLIAAIGDPNRLSQMSERNLSRSRAYAEVCLERKRYDFYRYVREATERWLIAAH